MDHYQFPRSYHPLVKDDTDDSLGQDGNETSPIINGVISSGGLIDGLHVHREIEIIEDKVVEVEEVIPKEINVVEEKEVVKVFDNEMIEVLHVPVINVLDYVLSSLQSSVVLSGSYLFIKERKRINVS